MTEPAPLLRSVEDGIATLTLHRPEARNALSIGLMTAFQTALDELGTREEARVVIVRAQGAAFCAGHDLKEMQLDRSRDAYERLFRQCSDLMLSIVRFPKPVIAEVQGMATAAGCQLVASCDLAIASDKARFATPGVNIGLFCSTPMVALSRNVSKKAAMEMLLSGEAISAERACELGLVNRVVPPEALSDETRALARSIADKSPFALAIGKDAFNRQAELTLEEAYRYASRIMTENMMAEDAEEGISAFLEKRKPSWRGR